MALNLLKDILVLQHRCLDLTHTACWFSVKFFNESIWPEADDEIRTATSWVSLIDFAIWLNDVMPALTSEASFCSPRCLTMPVNRGGEFSERTIEQAPEIPYPIEFTGVHFEQPRQVLCASCTERAGLVQHLLARLLDLSDASSTVTAMCAERSNTYSIYLR